jgi:hypothetical protein
LAVPSGERLLEGVAHVGTETETLRHLSRRETVRHQRALDALAAGHHQTRRETEAVECRAAEPYVAEHEAQHGQSGEIDLPAVTPERDVVAEPGRQLRGVGDAANPRQRRDVVEAASVVMFEADMIAQTSCDDPRPQDVLQRLAQPEVGREREGSDKFGQRDAGVSVAGFHGHKGTKLGIVLTGVRGRFVG